MQTNFSLSSPLLFIADAGTAPRPLIDIVREALSGGCRWVLYRDLHGAPHALLTQAKELRELCQNFSASFFISRHLDIAQKVEAQGVHLSANQSAKEARAMLGLHVQLGQSCHNMEEVRRAREDGAAYYTLSPIFETQSRPGYGPALGVEAIKAATAQIPLPLLALGGITPEKTKSCIAAGASGIAVMGDILRHAAPEKRVREYLAVIG